MATSVDIAPSTGATTSFLQAGPGASPGYSAIDVRRAFGFGPLQEGVVDSGSYEVTQRAAGANMTVDVAASTGNGAYVQGDAVTSQGLYYVPPHSAVVNLDIGAADATNPRVDQIVLRIYDDTHDASGANKAQVYVVAGTATGGATLDNRSGAASLPSSAIRLADVLVAAGATSVSNSSIRDRRPWARGANYSVARDNSSTYTTTSTSLVAIDSTNLNPRFEFSGVPVEVHLNPGYYAGSTALFGDIDLFLNGVQLSPKQQKQFTVSTTDQKAGGFSWRFTPSAGSTRLAPYWKTSTGTLTFGAGNTYALVLMVREIVAQNTANNTTTSG